MSDLIYVTSDLETIVDSLLEKNVINEWMKNYILVRNLNLIFFFFGTLCIIHDLQMF